MESLHGRCIHASGITGVSPMVAWLGCTRAGVPGMVGKVAKPMPNPFLSEKRGFGHICTATRYDIMPFCRCKNVVPSLYTMRMLPLWQFAFPQGVPRNSFQHV